MCHVTSLHRTPSRHPLLVILQPRLGSAPRQPPNASPSWRRRPKGQLPSRRQPPRKPPLPWLPLSMTQRPPRRRPPRSGWRWRLTVTRS